MVVQVVPVPRSAQRFKEEFRKNLRRYRTLRNYSREQLARRTGCKTSFLRKVEEGELDPTLEHVETIARALDVEPRAFWTSPPSD